MLSAENLRRDLLELWTSGKIPTRSILMITHNIEEAVTMADRIIIMEKDPGRVVAEHPVGLTYPRYNKDAAVIQHMDTIYSILAGQTQPEEIEMGAEPGQAGHMRALPSVSLNELTGLMEYMAEMPSDTANIYELPKELSVEPDVLLRLPKRPRFWGLPPLRMATSRSAPWEKRSLRQVLFSAKRFMPRGSSTCLCSTGCFRCCKTPNRKRSNGTT